MAHLTLIDRATNRSYRVDSADAVVGRDPSAAIVMEGEAAAVVSGRHARFFLKDGDWWLQDMGSRNGTFVAGDRLPANGGSHRVAVGDEIRFGASGPVLRVLEAAVRSFAATISEPMAAVTMQTVTEQRPSMNTASTRRNVRLVLRSSEGKRLSAQETEILIGRSTECAIRVEGDMALAVSRRHARVFYSGWKICIEDAGSRNGTWLNRKRVEQATMLQRGDIIEFGAGGPKLTVEDVALIALDVRRTQNDMPAQQTDQGYISELPTPPSHPAQRAAGDKKKP